MEFQEALVRLVISKPAKKGLDRDTETEKQKRLISFHRRRKWSVPSKSPRPESLETPKEFLCPITGSLMNDPVIVSSGHSFERVCVQACNDLAFTPTVADGSSPDFSNVIPNLALKKAIVHWCKKQCVDPPKPIDYSFAEKLVRSTMVNSQKKVDGRNVTVTEKPQPKLNHAVTELTRRSSTHFYSSSDESVETNVSTPPLELKTRPSCFSSASSSSEAEPLNPNPNPEEDELVSKLQSPQVYEIEEALGSLRKITRTKEEARVQFCTPRILISLRSLVASRYTNIQVNAVACLVNLSLEKVNKVKIVRSGIVPLLVDVLKGGYPESQEHACGAIFSLALEDHNKIAIGVLGVLPPLVHLLRSESERARNDSALALYHLSLVQSNRAKLVKLGSVTILLGMVKSGHMRSRVLLVLGNLASCVDGRSAILDAGGVECLVGMLRKGEKLESESILESCMSVLCWLSYGGLRFRGLAKTAGATEVLLEVEKCGCQRSRQKARRVLDVMKSRGVAEEEEEGVVDWEKLLDSGSVTNSPRHRLGGKGGDSRTHSS
ncbi:hypothetical protein K2173_020259 [Erythroxylum novogranatense]|uniref:RING-type E3 ubiquitin transferase n=1 Tax=Erythroxylum novogranatense TaxID=1862640 RepID=A0AAV8U7J9_9ROSI|nr:hypothetical protein K2173_020259 [Erythroxylum novogranatense]